MEWWKSFFELGGVVLLFLTFAFGAGFVLTGKKVTELQAERLRRFDSDLTGAKTELAKQQIRAATAEGNIALAAQHAKEADAKAEGFKADIAKANEGAAQAQAQVAGATAEAAKANLELARLKTPRTLSRAQQERIVARIAAFSGTPYDLWVSTDSDSTELMELIDTALNEAKWQFNTAGLIQFAGKAGVIAASGVSIHISADHEDTLEQPALALGGALMAEGIPITAVYRDVGEANKDKDKTRVHVFVGSKVLN